MKRILKYISYTLMYLVISVASAYGVILLSWNDSSNTSPSQSVAQIPEQISNILTGMMQNTSTNLTFDATISDKNDNALMALDGKGTVDFSNGLENIAAETQLNLAFDEQKLPLTIAYFEKELYLDVFGGKFYFDVDQTLTDIQQLLALMQVELPKLDFDFGSINLEELLPLLSDLKETSLDNGYLIELVLPFADVEIETDKDYKIISLSAANVNLGDLNINVRVGFDNSAAQKIERNKQEYLSANLLLQSVNGLAQNLALLDNIAFDGSINFNQNTFDFSFVASKNFDKIKLSLDENISLMLFNKNVYLDFYNLHYKFGINQISSLKSVLEAVGISLPEQIWNVLQPEKFQLKDVFSLLGAADLSKIDLSIFEQITQTENGISLSIKDFGKVDLSTSNPCQISIEGQDFSAKLQLNHNAKLPNFIVNEYFTVDFEEIAPYLETMSELFSSPAIEGTMNIKINNTSFSGNYRMVLEDGFELYLDLGQLQLALYDGKIYAQTGEISFIFNSFDEALSTMNGLLSLATGMEIKKQDLALMALSVLSEDVLPSLITCIDQRYSDFGRCLLVKLGDKINVKLYNNFTPRMIIQAGDNIQLDISMNSSDQTEASFEINESTAMNSTLVGLGLLALTIEISTTKKPTLEYSMPLFGFDMSIYLEFNSDKSIKTSHMSIESETLSITISKQNNILSIKIFGLEITSTQTGALKEEGQQVADDFPFPILSEYDVAA